MTRRFSVLAFGFLFHLAAAAHGQTAVQTIPTMTTPLSTTGITVGEPKVYDNYYLQLTLNNLRDQLSGLKVVDQATLLSHIGQTQGANLSQVGVAVQGGGNSTPSTSTFTLAPGDTSYSSTGSPASTTPGTTTTTTSLAPSNPAPAAAMQTIPTIGQSSLDTLNESMQLSSEITGYQLLLNGAISDQIQAASGLPKTTFTIGFPITIAPPNNSDRKLENSIAEIQVTVCTVQDASIVTLLPKERTYNVASLVDHSLAANVGAVIGGVFSIGGGFLWHRQSYYLVQQQETVALQQASGNCSQDGSATSPTSFVWQIHPVLGKKYVRPGTQNDFVQVSIPGSLTGNGEKLAIACVKVGWRKTKDNGNRLDSALTDPAFGCFKIKTYSTDPKIRSLSVADIGGGNVRVDATGTFLSGTRARIGSKLLSENSLYVSADMATMSFSTAASDVVTAGGITLLSREDYEVPLENQLLPPPAPPTGTPSLTPPAPTSTTPLKISAVTVVPYSSSQSLVTVTFARPSGPALPFEPCHIPGAVNPPHCVPSDPYVINLGSNLFGLSNAPYLSASSTEIKLIVSNDALAAAPQIEMRRLLWPAQYYYDSFPLSKDGVTVGKATLIASAPAIRFSVTGTNLNLARLQYPDCPDCLTASGTGFATVTLVAGKPPKGVDAASIKGLKQIVLCNKTLTGTDCDPKYTPVLLAVPTDAAASKDSKPKLEDHDPVKVGTKEVMLSGTGLDQIAQVKFEGTTLSFHLSAAKEPKLVLELSKQMYTNAGTYPVVVELADKSTSVYSVTVGDSAKP